MNFYDKYVRRVGRYGNSATESEINQTIQNYERDFKTSPSYHEVNIDGEPVDVIVNTTRAHDEKLVHFRPSFSPVQGSLIEFRDDKYLLMETDRNEIYKYGTMKQCNHTIELEYGEEKIFDGYESNGRPKYKTITRTEQVPCIVTSKYYSSNDNNQLPLPEGKISVFVNFKYDAYVDVNDEFVLFGKRYTVADIDYTQLENGVGVIEVIMERKVSV